MRSNRKLVCRREEIGTYMVTEAVGINETGTIVVIWDWLEGKSKSGQGPVFLYFQ